MAAVFFLQQNPYTLQLINMFFKGGIVMSKRKNKVQTISVMSGLEATIMPKFNTHAVGYGKWASRKDKQRKAERKADFSARRSYCGY